MGLTSLRRNRTAREQIEAIYDAAGSEIEEPAAVAGPSNTSVGEEGSEEEASVGEEGSEEEEE